jgi:DNA-binding transcriptional LysR family regulator
MDSRIVRAGADEPAPHDRGSVDWIEHAPVCVPQVISVEGGTADLVGAVREGRIHVALCFQDAAEPPREHEGTRRHDLLEEPMPAAVGPRHHLAGRARIRLAELANEPWTAATPGGLIHRACVAAGFEPRIAFRTADPLAIRALVASGLAVTLTPSLLVPLLEGISTLALAGDRPRRVVYAVTPPAREPTP